MKTLLKHWGFVATLLVVFGLFLHPINLTTADLGRHIINGQVTLESGIPNTNYYSYTYPDYSFFNHHWLSGVNFYLINQIGGFGLLSIWFAMVSAIAVGFGLSLVWQRSGWVVGIGSLIVFLPLILSRLEIRPEVFSNLFVMIFIWVLYKYQQGELGPRWLWALPLLSLVWVNTHIYFVLGWGIIGVFWLENLIRIRDKDAKARLVTLSIVGLMATLVCILNPNLFSGVLRPFQIYGNYGYRVLEEQSVEFLTRVRPIPVLSYYYWGLIALVGSWAWKFWRVWRKGEKWSIGMAFLSVVFSLLGWMMLRNFALFGLVAMVVVGVNLEGCQKWLVRQSKLAIWVGLAVLLMVMLMINGDYWLSRARYGIGLEQGNDLSARFVVDNGIKGPIFNNYDIGGYLIYYLYPKERVFVDNRPDAYPAEFFENEVIPAQENDQKWKELDDKYNFQTIFFFRHDATPWGQNFLISRVQDADWQAVWVDAWTIILVKRSGVNAEIAKQYGIPNEVFRVDRQ